MIIGGFTSLLVTPMALLFGMSAGYFGKRVDDAVQYTYTVLASIPDILLLIALLLVFGHGLDKLCYALGITSWVGLCRLVRGETLKHREREYVRAAKALGVSPVCILARHILPNLLPLVIISITLGFSGLVLAESILSYLGIGVEAGMGSWGNMIDAARLELAREVIVHRPYGKHQQQHHDRDHAHDDFSAETGPKGGLGFFHDLSLQFGQSSDAQGEVHF